MSVPAPGPTPEPSTEDLGPSLRPLGRRERRHAARRQLPFLLELPLLLLVALTAAVLIKTFLVQAFYIPSGSMIPTLEIGDRVLVNKLSYVIGEPQRGDIVVFLSPYNGEAPEESLLEAAARHVGEALGIRPAAADDFIKRVIAVAGETIEIRDSTVHIDGRPLDEPYLAPGTRMPDFGPVTVPEGSVFVMGDNRERSQDSRRFGPIPEEDIIGRAFVRIWPVSRWGGL